MMVDMDNNFAGISQIEKRYGFILPDDYKDFISNYDGEEPERDIFVFKNSLNEEEDSVVQYFFSINSLNEYDDFEHTYIFFISSEILPWYIVPIARDPFGNLICVSTSAKDYGKILFWDHEKNTEDSISLIANNFTEFINMLE